MNFERLAKSHFGRDFAIAIVDPLAMLFEKFRELGFGYAVMRCLERLPNFFAACKSSGIIAPRLMAEKIRRSGFCHVFVDLRIFIRATVEFTVKSGRNVFFSCQFAYEVGPVAQRLEQGTHNPLVPGSNPGGPSLRFGAEAKMRRLSRRNKM
jgi:hypothetical protein